VPCGPHITHLWFQEELGIKPGVVVHACNPSTQEAEAGNCKFKAILGHIARPLSKNNQPTKTTTEELDIKVINNRLLGQKYTLTLLWSPNTRVFTKTNSA
jgi:hypothetical protein